MLSFPVVADVPPDFLATCPRRTLVFCLFSTGTGLGRFPWESRSPRPGDYPPVRATPDFLNLSLFPKSSLSVRERAFDLLEGALGFAMFYFRGDVV